MLCSSVVFYERPLQLGIMGGDEGGESQFANDMDWNLFSVGLRMAQIVWLGHVCSSGQEVVNVCLGKEKQCK